MGSSLRLECDACDFSQLVLTGFGMASRSKRWQDPAFCPSCKWSGGALPGRCRKCKGADLLFYGSDEALQDPSRERGDEEEELIRELSFQRNYYLCPKCGEFKLKLNPGLLLWD